MKVLHVVPTYLPAVRYGGPIYSVHGLCKGLVQQGVEVHVVTTSVDGPCDSDVPLGRPVELDGVKVWYFPSRFLRRLYWSPAMRRHLASTIADFDLVHVHSVFLWPTWAAARLARQRGVPYFLSPRGMLVKDLIRRKSRFIKSLWLALIERYTIRDAACLHFTSEVEAREFEQLGYPHRGHCVIHNGVEEWVGSGMADSESLSADVARVIDGGDFLLFLGRLNWKKGIDRLLDALAVVPAARLVIAGNDEENYLMVVRRQIKELSLADRVTIIPRFVSGADKDALLRHALLFVLPSYNENFGNTVAEAMAAGCPVVVTEEVGAAELLRTSGAGDVVPADGLSATLAATVADQEKRARQAERGQAWAREHLLWAGIAGQMLQEYRKRLARPDQRH